MYSDVLTLLLDFYSVQPAEWVSGIKAVIAIALYVVSRLISNPGSTSIVDVFCAPNIHDWRRCDTRVSDAWP